MMCQSMYLKTNVCLFVLYEGLDHSRELYVIPQWSSLRDGEDS